jgi:dethiobiotin synthetase
LWSVWVRDLLVTGTDTGVGKTTIATALVGALRLRGVRALGFKPAETGIGAGEESDSERLARASGERHPLAAPLLQLHEPLAPAVAANRAGAVLKPEDIESRIAQLRREGCTLVVEGAGGVMVPLVWGEVRLKPDPTCSPIDSPDCSPDCSVYTVLDLAERCGLDAIVVGRAGLGTLNHIALTVRALQSRCITVRGVVLNGRASPPDLAEATNPLALARMLPGIRIIEVPRHCLGSAVAITDAAIDGLLEG